MSDELRLGELYHSVNANAAKRCKAFEEAKANELAAFYQDLDQQRQAEAETQLQQRLNEAETQLQQREATLKAQLQHIQSQREAKPPQPQTQPQLALAS